MMISFPDLGETVISAPCNYFSALAGHLATVSHHILMNIKEREQKPEVVAWHRHSFGSLFFFFRKRHMLWLVDLLGNIYFSDDSDTMSLNGGQGDYAPASNLSQGRRAQAQDYFGKHHAREEETPHCRMCCLLLVLYAPRIAGSKWRVDFFWDQTASRIHVYSSRKSGVH